MAEGNGNMGISAEGRGDSTTHHITATTTTAQEHEIYDQYHSKCSVLQHLAYQEHAHVQGDHTTHSTYCQGHQRPSDSQSIADSSAQA